MPSIWKRWRDRGGRETPEQQARQVVEERHFLAMDYRFVFASEPGQRVLADILRRAGVMQSTYDAHPSNAAFAEGKRRVALEIIEMINADPADRQRLALTGTTEELFPMPRED